MSESSSFQDKRINSTGLLSSAAAPFVATAANIIILFVIYSLLRVEYLFENLQYFKPSIEEGRIWSLLFAGPVFDTPGIMYTNALYVLMMLLPLHLKEREGYYKVCKWIFIVINSIAILVNLGDSIYFSYTMRRTTTEVFGEFSGEGNLFKIFGTEFINHWYLVLFAILLIWLMWKLYVNPRSFKCHEKPTVAYYAVSIIALVIGAITVISGIRGGWLNHWYNYLLAIPLAYGAFVVWKRFGSGFWGKGGSAILAVVALGLVFTAPIGGWRHRDIRPISLSNANSFTAHPVETALILNTPFTLIRTIGLSPFSNPHYFDDKEELEKIYSPVFTPGENINDKRRKNIVVIIVESFGREYIGALSKDMIGEDYKGYSPFTDSLINHSLAFKYSFCNGRKSIDGMPSVLAGIPMFVKPFVLTPQSLNKLKGLPGNLSQIGYETAFFHGARTGSMGFDGFAKSIGFEKYYGREDFNADPRFGGDKDFDGYWAIWDEPFLQFFAKKMGEMKQPFMSAVFTASSHHPFHIPDKYKTEFPEEGLPIHKCIRYTDNAIRRFFEIAKKEPWFDNTIFVITSDHTNMSDHQEYKTDLGGFCSPIIIYDPSGEIAPGMKEGIAQHIDIMPTLLNYVGFPYPFVAFGKDLFDETENQDWAVNYLNGIYQYVRYGYVLQFDGKRSVALYALSDKLMKNNLVGTTEIESQMERELKAIIQSYMDRMAGDALTIN